MTKKNTLINLGCRLNIYEGEIIKNHLNDNSLNHITVINSCAVTAEAEKKVAYEIRKAKIPTFAVAGRAVAGGTYASNFFMHDFIIIESKCVENILFSGKRVTANILKGTDQIPDDFGTGSGVMKSGLADITLENRKELKETIIKLANIILKKEESKIKNVEEVHEGPEDFEKTASTAS